MELYIQDLKYTNQFVYSSLKKTLLSMIQERKLRLYFTKCFYVHRLEKAQGWSLKSKHGIISIVGNVDSNKNHLTSGNKRIDFRSCPFPSRPFWTLKGTWSPGRSRGLGSITANSLLYSSNLYRSSGTQSLHWSSTWSQHLSSNTDLSRKFDNKDPQFAEIKIISWDNEYSLLFKFINFIYCVFTCIGMDPYFLTVLLFTN